jgi:hypothetical protein
MLEHIQAVLTGSQGRVCVPGKYRIWRDETGFHIEVFT